MTDTYSAEAERRVREDLAAAYQLAALFEMDDSIYTRFSVRVPGTHEHFLINPFGRLFQRNHRIVALSKSTPRQHSQAVRIRCEPCRIYNSQRHPCCTAGCCLA